MTDMSDSPKIHLTTEQIDAILKEKLEGLKKRSKLLDLILTQPEECQLDLVKELIGEQDDGTAASDPSSETPK